MQMNIEPGQYIKKISEPDEEMKSLSLAEQQNRIKNKVKHYLILAVDNEQIDVLYLNGTPPLDSQVFTYDEVVALYSITEIPLKNVKLTPLYRYCKINSIEGMYEWHLNTSGTEKSSQDLLNILTGMGRNGLIVRNFGILWRM